VTTNTAFELEEEQLGLRVAYDEAGLEAFEHGEEGPSRAGPSGSSAALAARLRAGSATSGLSGDAAEALLGPVDPLFHAVLGAALYESDEL
jgi:hypothetical protein